MRDISTKNNLLCNFFRLVLHTGAGASLGTDLSSGSQCDLGQRGACQLIHQHREQHHVAHHVAVRELGGCGSHAQCHTGLRQQGDAEVLLDIITAAGRAAAGVGAGNLTGRASNDIHHADEQHKGIGEDGQVIGIMSSRDALKLAKEAELDLVKIAPQAKPPVCKIIDYGKYRYELARKEKEARKKQKTMEIKEVRLSPNIDTNDLNTKVNQARKFLTHGDKVKVTLRFRGRELAHVEQTKGILDEFAEKLSDIAVIDKPAKFEGRSMIMFLTEKR